MEIGAPLPNAGEGLRVRGLPARWIRPTKPALDEGFATLTRAVNRLLAPSPLAPLPRWW